jgi:TorA maturation chaperone TorD
VSDQQDATEGEEKKPEISIEDRVRAGLYGLLGVVLTEPPDAEQLMQIAAMRPNESPLGKAMGRLSQTAMATDPRAVAAEFKTLFGSILKPVASAHVADKEAFAAALKADNERLGITPFEGEDGPEDHIAALCDTMAGLILSQHNEGLTPQDHKAFFLAHIAPWAGKFFEGLEGKRTAKFYAPVGSLGKELVASEIVLCGNAG